MFVGSHSRIPDWRVDVAPNISDGNLQDFACPKTQNLQIDIEFALTASFIL